MSKVNPKNGNETKSDSVPQDIFKSDILFSLVLIYYTISMTFIFDIF